MWFLENAWLIPLVPAASFFLILFFGKRLPLKGAEIAILALSTSLALSIGTAYQWIQRVDDAHGGEGAFGLLRSIGRSFVYRAEEAAPFVAPVKSQMTWWQNGGQEFTAGTLIDGLSVTMMLVVSLITTLVLIYSVEYMKGDRRFTYFFAAMALFAAGMLTMVSASNTLLFLIGWELMGVTSFMLIGHWWEEYPNARAALKAFFTVRTGDVGILIGFIILFFGANAWAVENLGSSGFDIQAIQAWALSGEATRWVIVAAAAGLLWATIGKSGQFPLHTWLPDAMAGPTPVSSLLHSSTMVVAGVFLIARFYPVFWEGFDIADGGWNWVALVGGITIIIAALLAFVQVDIKKVLAYSTVSQLGYMVMGLGVGAWTAATFHIFTHAWFKALLFLCAGSVSHSGSHHSFDMKKDMGGLRKHMPITFWTWIVGSLALAGIFPLAGFWSKDEILANAGHNGYQAFMIVGLAGAFMTAAYMARATYLTFFGEYRGGGEHALADQLEEDLHPPSGTEVSVDDYEMAEAVVGATHAGEADHAPAGGHGGHGHGAHDAHEPHHAGPHESPPLITVPLVILAVLAIFAGFINAVAFDIEKFKEWVEPSAAVVVAEEATGGTVIEGGGPGDVVVLPLAEEGGEEGSEKEAGPPPAGSVQTFPKVDHAPFKWSEAFVSLALAAAGIVVGFAMSVAVYERRFLKGYTKQSKLAGAAYGFLWNKYYLDWLYEKVIVAFVSGPLARASYWVNMKVIDKTVDTVGAASVEVGDWVYDHVDQGLVDGIVNGAGDVAEGAGEALRPVQSGRVQQYGALLFSAAAVGALVLVIVVV